MEPMDTPQPTLASVPERRPSFFKTFNALFTVPLAVLFAGLMISGSILYVGSTGTATIANAPTDADGQQAVKKVLENPESLVAKNDPILGDKDAPVTIVEFSDFQCPFCRAFFEGAYSQIKKEYVDTGKVRIVFRDFPLAFHEAARPASLAGQCALEQGKFWEYHDKMFQEQAKKGQGTVAFGVPELKTWATEIGLNASQFNTCLDTAKYDADVQADMDAGTDVGVSGTPSFFVNGTLLVGAQPFSAFQELIEAALDN